MRLRSQTILQIVGLAACALGAVQGGLLLAFGSDPGVFAWVFLVVCYGGFGATFWWTLRRSPDLPATRKVVSLLAIQAVLGLFVATELLYIVAAEVPFVLRRRAAVGWMAVQGALSLAWGVLAWQKGGFVPVEGLGNLPEVLRNGLTILWVLTWQGLAFATGWIAASESRGRSELARLNAELLATRELLADSSRLAERLHIARELHDSLGHHLAALTVNLDRGRQGGGART